MKSCDGSAFATSTRLSSDAAVAFTEATWLAQSTVLLVEYVELLVDGDGIGQLSLPHTRPVVWLPPAASKLQPLATRRSRAAPPLSVSTEFTAATLLSTFVLQQHVESLDNAC